MVFRRLSRELSHRRSKRLNEGSIGVPLRPEECFSIKIQNNKSDLGKDKIFGIPMSPRNIISSKESASVSTITDNSGSTAMDRSMTEYSVGATRTTKKRNNVNYNMDDAPYESSGGTFGLLCCGPGILYGEEDATDMALVDMYDDEEEWWEESQSGVNAKKRCSKKFHSSKVMAFLKKRVEQMKSAGERAPKIRSKRAETQPQPIF